MNTLKIGLLLVMGLLAIQTSAQTRLFTNLYVSTNQNDRKVRVSTPIKVSITDSTMVVYGKKLDLRLKLEEQYARYFTRAIDQNGEEWGIVGIEVDFTHEFGHRPVQYFRTSDAIQIIPHVDYEQNVFILVNDELVLRNGKLYPRLTQRQ